MGDFSLEDVGVSGSAAAGSVGSVVPSESLPRPQQVAKGCFAVDGAVFQARFQNGGPESVITKGF